MRPARRVTAWAPGMLALVVLCGCPAAQAPAPADAAPDAGPGDAAPLDGGDALPDPCLGAPDGAPCDDGDHCTSGDACVDGACTGEVVTCAASGSCQVPACDPRFGCYESPAPEGEPCALPCFGEAACAAGACVPVAESAVVCPAPEADCVDHLLCDPASGECTIPVRATTGTACDVDDDVCTVDVCNEEGACVPTGGALGCAWRAVDEPCWSWVCDPAIGCTKGAYKEGVACDDGDPCTVDDACAEEQICAGTPLPSDDGNDCTEDVCAAGKVAHTNLTGTACLPDHPCAKVGVCATGVCLPDDPACVCAGDGDCDDGDPCTVDACGEDGLCAPSPLDCDDGDPCTLEGCSGDAGCTHEPGPAIDAEEACNGADDDCDGLVDEDFPGLGEPCDGGDEGACAGGTLACADGAVACVGDEGDPAESCNGLDDDCDALVDEDFPGLGAACDGDDADACALGVVVCAGEGTACEEPGPGQAERCNGLDDDCDGEVDEGFPGLGDPCTPDAVASCPDGFVVCTPDELGVACRSAADDETCNGVDDDCDGFVDPPGALGCLTWYRDLDGDGWGKGGACLCAPTETFSTTDGGDCDDGDAGVLPQGAAVCGADGDCDGSPVDPGEGCDDGDADPQDGCHACAIVPFAVAPDGRLPDVAALPDGGFVVAWRGDGILAARFDADAAPLGEASPATLEAVGPPRVGRVAGGTLVAWSDGTQARGRVLTDAGGLVGPPEGVALGPVTGDSPPSVAPAGEGAVVAWALQGEETSVVRWRLVDAAGSPLGDLGALEAEGSAVTPEVAAVTGGFALVAVVGPAGQPGAVVARLHDAAGAPETPLVVVADEGSWPDVVAGPAGGAVVAWVGPEWDLHARAVLADGTLGPTALALPGAWLEPPRVAPHPAGGLVAAGVPLADWRHVTAARLDAAGTPVATTPIGTVATWASRHPRPAAFGDGSFLVVWEQEPWAGSPTAAIHAQRFNADGSLRYR